MIKSPRIENFLFKHGEYVHPDYVVRNKKRVSLLAVERQYALFAETDPGVDIHGFPSCSFHSTSRQRSWW